MIFIMQMLPLLISCLFTFLIQRVKVKMLYLMYVESILQIHLKLLNLQEFYLGLLNVCLYLYYILIVLRVLLLSSLTFDYTYPTLLLFFSICNEHHLIKLFLHSLDIVQVVMVFSLWTFEFLLLSLLYPLLLRSHEPTVLFHRLQRYLVVLGRLGKYRMIMYFYSLIGKLLLTIVKHLLLNLHLVCITIDHLHIKHSHFFVILGLLVYLMGSYQGSFSERNVLFKKSIIGIVFHLDNKVKKYLFKD